VTATPLWLQSEPIRELLNLLVNRLDAAEQRGSSKAQSVALGDRTWPALYKAPMESTKEDLWEHVVAMAKWGWLQVKPEDAVGSGFKGSAQRLRSSTGCSLFYAGKGALGGDLQVAFEAWLFGQGSTPVYFWGDLDHSGMRILAAMRSTFPDLMAWAPGYAPMLAALLGGGGHSPEAAEKQGQRPVVSTGCEYADRELIPALAQSGRYLDQELFSL
jgi:hypothetical protein